MTVCNSHQQSDDKCGFDKMATSSVPAENISECVYPLVPKVKYFSDFFFFFFEKSIFFNHDHSANILNLKSYLKRVNGKSF